MYISLYGYIMTAWRNNLSMQVSRELCSSGLHSPVNVGLATVVVAFLNSGLSA